VVQGEEEEENKYNKEMCNKKYAVIGRRGKRKRLKEDRVGT